MNIEVGKTYVSVDGRQVHIVSKRKVSGPTLAEYIGLYLYETTLTEITGYFHLDGRSASSNDLDIISEYKEPRWRYIAVSKGYGTPYQTYEINNFDKKHNHIIRIDLDTGLVENVEG